MKQGQGVGGGGGGGGGGRGVQHEMVDLSMDAQEDGALTTCTITNPAYGMVKQGGGGEGEGGGGEQPEIVGKSPGTDPLTTTTAK